MRSFSVVPPDGWGIALGPDATVVEFGSRKKSWLDFGTTVATYAVRVWQDTLPEASRGHSDSATADLILHSEVRQAKALSDPASQLLADDTTETGRWSDSIGGKRVYFTRYDRKLSGEELGGTYEDVVLYVYIPPDVATLGRIYCVLSRVEHGGQWWIRKVDHSAAVAVLASLEAR